MDRRPAKAKVAELRALLGIVADLIESLAADDVEVHLRVYLTTGEAIDLRGLTGELELTCYRHTEIAAPSSLPRRNREGGAL